MGVSDDLREDRWAGGRAPAGGAGYNPYRASDGKFAPGAHHERPHAGHAAGRAWNLSFDARGHQKQIEHHKKAETLHRAASLKHKAQMHDLKARAKAASPGERAALEKKFREHEAKHATHHAAAKEARAKRTEVSKDLERARAEHAAERRAQIASRKEAAAARAHAEREGIGVVGRHRIGGESEHAPAGGSTQIPHLAATPEHHFAIGAHRVAGEPAAPHKESPLETLARRKRELYGEGGYVHKPAPRQQPEQNAAHAAARQESERAARARYEAGRPKSSEMPAAAHVVELPRAQVVLPGLLTRAKASLRKMLRRDSVDEWRTDRGVGIVSKGTGRSASGKGYNPYRSSDGKFGAGAHKARPKVDRVASAAAAVEKRGARVAHLSKGLEVKRATHAAAVGAARHALDNAKAKAEIARAKPTQKNIKAAQAATNKATRAKAKVDEHSAAISKHEAAHATATAKHAEAQQKHSGLQEKTKANAAKPMKTAPRKESAAGHAPTPKKKQATDAELADSVHAAAARIPAEQRTSMGSKVFISDIHAHMTPAEREQFGGSLESFKGHLDRLGKSDRADVLLSRADTPVIHVNHGRTKADRNASVAKVKASELGDGNRTRHFMEVRPAAPAHDVPQAAPAHAAAGPPKAMTMHEFDAAKSHYDKAITDGERQSLLAYSSWHAVDMNKKLREDTPDPDRAKMRADIDAALDKHRMASSTLLYRGVSAEAPAAVLAYYKSLKPGDVFSDKGYVSTSAHLFGTLGGHIKLHITVPEGGRGAPIPSVKPQEREVLLPRGSRFRIDKVEEKWDGGANIHVTALED